ncbi:oxidoreductase ptaK [Fulvia fulva]|nr:oxidoreductase ptaK [Fulvia fulva]
MSLLLPVLEGLGNVTFINNLLSSVGVLVSLVPGLLQNRNSPLGILLTPVTPDTGVTRYYNFDVARGMLAPEGIPKPMLLIQVTVKSPITGPEEGTALHWHRLLQKKTTWYDGVPSVPMCPIAPGESFVYRFQADLYDSSWWHSHYSAQYAGGLFGPMIIHGPTDNYPSGIGEVVDFGPVIVSDSYFTDYYTLVEQSMSNNALVAALVTSGHTLIQGKGNVDCSTAPAGSNCTTNAGLAKFNFKPGRTHLLRIINTSAAGLMVVSLDNHKMTLFVGQRTDVLITADQRPNAYWLRVRQPTLCPYYPIKLAPPDVTLVIQITQAINATGHTHYEMNGQTFSANYNYPLLNCTFNGNTSYPDDPQWNVFNFGSNETVRIIWQNNVPFGHPMHIHGQNLYVVGEGVGAYNGVNAVRPSNPQRSDVHSLRPNGYLVTQLVSDNPGVWPFHCHIAWHVGQGLYINVMQKPEMIQQGPETPGIIAEACDAWWTYTENNIPDQIDPGLKKNRLKKDKFILL